ncbi:hypothetical protein PTTG_00706 [Puccinia triticina 1-1 BBBD Race 1]|uniref:Uncharacterized protein n=1 Tax=Puccinia triticina (isolate 1-1 / race 1 (BBBD)) TaxID=630390 RepID=A0A180GC01_PUCT1|nr:hypothetical protein PTTG_00706 [Puccinia triticina 1-1 BBBD Race 1]
MYKTDIQLARIVEDKACGSDIEDAGGDRAPVSLIPDWRSAELTTILHSLDKMVITEAEHHKTIAANLKLYGRSARNFKTTKGMVGVPRNLPLDSYAKAYLSRLTSFERDTLSKVPAMGLDLIAQKMQLSCNLQPGPSASGLTAAAPGGGTGSDAHATGGGGTGGQPTPTGGDASMHVDG